MSTYEWAIIFIATTMILLGLFMEPACRIARNWAVARLIKHSEIDEFDYRRIVGSDNPAESYVRLAHLMGRKIFEKHRLLNFDLLHISEQLPRVGFSKATVRDITADIQDNINNTAWRKQGPCFAANLRSIQLKRGASEEKKNVVRRWNEIVEKDRHLVRVFKRLYRFTFRYCIKL